MAAADTPATTQPMRNRVDRSPPALWAIQVVMPQNAPMMPITAIISRARPCGDSLRCTQPVRYGRNTASRYTE